MNTRGYVIPWRSDLLRDWSIVGMNHYCVDGKKMIFVSMEKDGVCIKEEGPDDNYLWDRLWTKAYKLRGGD